MNEELNKKLAEWAGFQLRGNPYYSTERVSDGEGGFYLEQVKYQSYWDKDGYAYLELPNFTQSLDACFKWLVPKLIKDYATELVIISEYSPYRDNWTATIEDSFYNSGEAKRVLSSASGNTQALALCLTIEELIDTGIGT